ncbi:MAG: C-type lectin domain-containing protein [Verrucomicrobiota bacterium]
MNPIVTLSVSLLIGSSLALEAATLVGPVTNPANHHWYYLLAEDTWQNSETQAVDLGGHLVTINDQAEQDWVFSTFGSYGGTNRSLWIGFREVNVEANYQWSSGESVEYTHWLPGQPDNSPVTGGESYVHMLNTGNEYGHPGGFWNDLASPNAVFPTFNPLCGVVEVLAPDSPVLSIRLSPLEICWSSLTNRLYQLEYCSDLTVNLWTALGSPKPGNGNTFCVVDAVVQGEANRFYRVVLLP